MRKALFLVVLVGACDKPKPLPPPPPPPPAVLVELALGSQHACARTDRGTVFCWGANEHGQVGNTLTVKQSTPQRIADIVATQLTAGAGHTCAIDKAGAIDCWGSNEHGQLGDGTLENRSAPTKVLDSGPWAQVAAGQNITCARKKADGAVFCWGETSPGVSVKAPTVVAGLPTGAEQVEVGQAHVCARFNDASVKCWGENYKRQLGVSKKAEKNIPVDVPEIQAAQLALGPEHSCARTPSGEVMCWGGGLVCVPGTPSPGRIVAVKPAKVAGMDNVVDVQAGGPTVCATFADGQIGCAVLNEKDQSCSTERVAPEALYGVRVLGVGDGFGCVVLKGGTEAYCWGRGGAGQLGDGKAEDHLKPEAIKHPVEDQPTDVPPEPKIDKPEPSATASASSAAAAPAGAPDAGDPLNTRR